MRLVCLRNARNAQVASRSRETLSCCMYQRLDITKFDIDYNNNNILPKTVANRSHLFVKHSPACTQVENTIYVEAGLGWTPPKRPAPRVIRTFSPLSSNFISFALKHTRPTIHTFAALFSPLPLVYVQYNCISFRLVILCTIKSSRPVSSVLVNNS